jgi:hypothetical protein
MVMIEWQLDLQLPVQSVPISTKVVSSNPTDGEVYSIQHYVIKFVSTPKTIKTDRYDVSEILLKVVLDTMIIILILYREHNCQQKKDKQRSTKHYTENQEQHEPHVFRKD